MAVNKVVKSDGTTLIDITGTTATASDVASGKVFFASDGTQTTGTASGGGGGSSSWTLVASTSYQVSTTSTSAATVATWATGHSEIWTADKIVYVRIRDTAGKRAGYFYGTDTFFSNYTMKNHPEYTNVSERNGSVRNIFSCNSSGDYTWRYGYSSTGYGVYVEYFSDNGDITVCSRYNSNYSRTINGTYSVEVYLLAPPSAIFT